MAIKVALMRLKDIPEGTSEHYRISFNLVLYYLVGGSTEDAEMGYTRLLSTCSLIVALQYAADDVRDFLTVQPTHEFARRILEKIQARIGELGQRASS